MDIRVHNLAACIPLLFLVISQLPDSSFQSTDDFTEASELARFPDLLDPELRKIRLQYELNSYHVDDDNLIHYKSALLDEAYSIEGGRARIINYRNGESRDLSSEYDAFYWIPQNNLQSSIWLKPFICINSTLSLDDRPILCSAIRDFFPSSLSSLLVYTIDSGHRLFGLSSILAHAHEDPNLQRLEMINLWQLKLENELVFEFKMMDVATEKVVSNMNRLIGFQVNVEMKNKFKLQISVLQADNEFSDSILEWPVEYGCRLIPDTFQDLNPKALETSPRTEYELEVSIVTEGILSKQPSIIAALPPYTPRDTMSNPTVHLVNMRLVYDKIDNMIVIDQEDGLHVWRLDDKLMYHVDKNSDTCAGPLEIPQQDTKDVYTTSGNLSQYCSSDLIGFNLSSDLILKLNEEALRLLRFSLPEIKRLIRAELIQDEVYELTYLDHNNNLCLFLNDKLVSDSMKTVRIFKRFVYYTKTSKLEPRTTSILYFTDSDCSKLKMQLDLNLISVGSFQPWMKPRHLIDLSSCSRQFKGSALLTIEYPLRENWSILEQVDKPHEVIRQGVAHYMHFTYNLSPLRIPQIEVHIEQSLLKVEVRVLDRTTLYLDSSYLPVVNVIASSYQNWLRRATHSILASDIKSCADYCQEFSCLVYVYCRTMQSCFVFKSASFGSSLGGSYEGPEMSCEARHVKQERFKNPNVLWANQKSWSLEEIIEDIEESFEESDLDSESSFGKKRPKLSLDMIARWRNTQTLSRMIRLEPEYVHHQYELELDSPDSPEEYTIHAPKIDHIIRSNFVLLLSGWTFGTRLWSQTMDLHQPDLQISQGYWSNVDIPLSECVQLCLQDPKCLTLSYCSSATSQCVLTQLNATNIVSLLNEQEVSREARLNHIVVRQNDACALMKRTFLDQYEYFDEQQETQLPAAEILDTLEVDSIEDCATSCMANRVVGIGATTTTGVCLSFSYCERGQSQNQKKSKCLLHERHLITEAGHSIAPVPTGSTPTALEASKCQHYVRKFMADFTRQNRRKIPERFVSMKLSNLEEENLERNNFIGHQRRLVSLNHCAKLCEEDENCGAFDYCTSANTGAPDGLQISCSLGSQETLELLPEVISYHKAHKESVNNSLHLYLERSNSCAVYLYKSKSLVYWHKKRNLSIYGESLESPETEQGVPILGIINTDLMIFGLFFFLAAMWSELRGSLPFSRLRLSTLTGMRGGSRDMHIELLRQDGSAPLNAPGTPH